MRRFKCPSCQVRLVLFEPPEGESLTCPRCLARLKTPAAKAGDVEGVDAEVDAAPAAAPPPAAPLPVLSPAAPPVDAPPVAVLPPGAPAPGAPIRVPEPAGAACPDCAEPLPAGARFCPDCGARTSPAAVSTRPLRSRRGRMLGGGTVLPRPRPGRLPGVDRQVGRDNKGAGAGLILLAGLGALGIVPMMAGMLGVRSRDAGALQLFTVLALICVGAAAAMSSSGDPSARGASRVALKGFAIFGWIIVGIAALGLAAIVFFFCVCVAQGVLR